MSTTWIEMGEGGGRGGWLRKMRILPLSNEIGIPLKEGEGVVHF